MSNDEYFAKAELASTERVSGLAVAPFALGDAPKLRFELVRNALLVYVSVQPPATQVLQVDVPAYEPEMFQPTRIP